MCIDVRKKPKPVFCAEGAVAIINAKGDLLDVHLVVGSHSPHDGEAFVRVQLNDTAIGILRTITVSLFKHDNRIPGGSTVGGRTGRIVLDYAGRTLAQITDDCMQGRLRKACTGILLCGRQGELDGISNGRLGTGLRGGIAPDLAETIDEENAREIGCIEMFRGS